MFTGSLDGGPQAGFDQSGAPAGDEGVGAWVVMPPPFCLSAAQPLEVQANGGSNFHRVMQLLSTSSQPRNGSSFLQFLISELPHPLQGASSITWVTNSLHSLP